MSHDPDDPVIRTRNALWAAFPHLPGFVTYLHHADHIAPYDAGRTSEPDTPEGDEVPPILLGEDS